MAARLCRLLACDRCRSKKLPADWHSDGNATARTGLANMDIFNKKTGQYIQYFNYKNWLVAGL